MGYIGATQLTDIYQSNLLIQSFGKRNNRKVEIVPDSNDRKIADLYDTYSPIRLNFLYFMTQIIIHSI